MKVPTKDTCEVVPKILTVLIPAYGLEIVHHLIITVLLLGFGAYNPIMNQNFQYQLPHIPSTDWKIKVNNVSTRTKKVGER